jgi:hypothetical protein
MRYFTLKKKCFWSVYFQKTEKNSEVTIFKNQYFLNNKNHLLMVLRQEANDSLLPVYQVYQASKHLDLTQKLTQLC